MPQHHHKNYSEYDSEDNTTPQEYQYTGHIEAPFPTNEVFLRILDIF